MSLRLPALALCSLFAASAPLWAQAPPRPAPAAPPAVAPKVVLSAAHAKASKVRVGEALPAAEVKDAAGQARPLAGLRGQGLTAFVFWNNDHRVSAEAVRRLPKLLAAVKGITIVAIHSGKATAAPPMPAADSPVIHATDAASAALSAVCTDGKVPRIYLVDKAGLILWLDIEFSIDTERHIQDAARFYGK
jgi:hypothetical protein